MTTSAHLSGFAKIAPWRLAHRDNSLAKEPGPVAGWANVATAFFLYQRAVSCKANLPQVLITPGLPTRAQEFCSPSLQPSRRCKTHAFLPTQTPPFSNLIMTRKLQPIYRDFAILTTSS